MTSEQYITAIWDKLSPAVEASIKASGGFTPLGGTVDRAGMVEAVVASGADPLALLEHEMRVRASSGNVVATVRATNAKVQTADSPEPAVGILLRYDDANGASQMNFMSYALQDGQIVYGRLHAQEGEHDLFGR